MGPKYVQRTRLYCKTIQKSNLDFRRGFKALGIAALSIKFVDREKGVELGQFIESRVEAFACITAVKPPCCPSP